MIVKQLGSALVLAAAFLAAAAALRYGANSGMISDDVARRSIQVLIGLGLAAWGNLMPKQRGRSSASIRAETWSQSVLRIGGWSMTLAGLVYAGLWVFAPLSFANAASIWVVLGATLVLLGSAVRAYVSCRRSTVA